MLYCLFGQGLLPSADQRVDCTVSILLAHIKKKIAIETKLSKAYSSKVSDKTLAVLLGGCGHQRDG